MQRPTLDARSGSARARGVRNAHYGIDGQLKSGTDEVTGQPVNFPESTGDRLRPGPSAAWQKAFGRKPAVPAGAPVMNEGSGGRTVVTRQGLRPSMTAAADGAVNPMLGATIQGASNAAQSISKNPYSANAAPAARAAVGNLSLSERGARIRSRLAAEGRLNKPAAPDMRTPYGTVGALAALNNRTKGRADGIYDEKGSRYTAGAKAPGVYDETGAKFVSGDEKRRRLLNRAASGPQFSTPKVGTMPSYA